MKLGDSTTSGIVFDVDVLGLKNALEALPDVDSAGVTRTPHLGNGYIWNITFTGNAGDVPLLVVNAVNLHGADVSANSKTLVNGGCTKASIDSTVVQAVHMANFGHRPLASYYHS